MCRTLPYHRCAGQIASIERVIPLRDAPKQIRNPDRAGELYSKRNHAASWGRLSTLARSRRPLLAVDGDPGLGVGRECEALAPKATSASRKKQLSKARVTGVSEANFSQKTSVQ